MPTITTNKEEDTTAEDRTTTEGESVPVPVSVQEEGKGAHHK